MLHESNGGNAWLPFLPMGIPQGNNLLGIATDELRNGLLALNHPLCARIDMAGFGDGFEITKEQDGLAIKGGSPGVLYGVYRLLSLLAQGKDPETPFENPFYPLRMLNHWDNMDGSVERGYAGPSFFFRDNAVHFDEACIHRYARMLASVGINAICPSNVNVHPPMDLLIDKTFLPDMQRLADILRLYGIRLLLSIEFSMPASHGLPTADPEDPVVQGWWKDRANLVYSYIPDLLGFLVKADSEYRPGPFTYGRTHAQGANMLARALAPHGGLLFWRCFVYNHKQDWRDRETDRPKAAYAHYAPQDGQFDSNVILQIKNGPLDFQVREPLSPLLLAMPKTGKALEIQLAQEYTGHQIDLFYQAPQWKDFLSHLPKDAVRSISAVGNLGADENWCGHPLAQANLYAYGRTAWLGESRPEEFALEWARLCFPRAAEAITGILLKSPGIYEKYAAPLGLGFMVNPHNHYGPSPEGYEFSLWGTYHRANREAIGVDRSTRGTQYTAQYPETLKELYDSPDTCPEKLLLFFHRLGYGWVMKDGRSLLQRIYDDHFEGADEAEELGQAWEKLRGRVPDMVHEAVLQKLMRQSRNAREWRDVINTYFFRLSGVPDQHGRLIFP